MTVDPRSILITRMSEHDLHHLELFDCGDEEMNQFLKTECFIEQQAGLNSTTVLYYNGQLAAFVSICADTIKLTNSERKGSEIPRHTAPALKVARLGRDVKFRDKQFGRMLLDEVFATAFHLYDNMLGIRYVTLDAYPNRVGYYQELGFVENRAKDYQERTTVSMRRDILEGAYDEESK